MTSENDELGIGTPEWAGVIELAISEALFHVNTAMPGYVKDYDASTQSCSVQPALKRAMRDGDGGVEIFDLPVIQNVPVMNIGGNGYRISMALKAGDVVVLLCSQRSLDKWLEAAQGQTIDPLDARKHDLSDAIAIPGIRQRRSPMPDPGDDMVIGAEDGSSEVKITKGGDVTIKASGKIKLGEGAASPAVKGTELAAFINGTMKIPSPLGPLGPAIPPLVLGTELSTKVDVE